MPETIAHEAVARAKELGLTLNDYVNLLLAEDIRPGSTARQEGIDTAA